MSIKTLSRKVKNRLNVTVGDLIRAEIIKSAELSLVAQSVKATSRTLGFKEANHFSAFFKQYKGMPPSEYQDQVLHLQT